MRGAAPPHPVISTVNPRSAAFRRNSPLLELLIFGALMMSRVPHSTKIPIWVVAAMTSFVGAGSALAAPADDLSAIRDAITNLRQDYEAKIKDLEDRLQKAQAEAEAAKASADSAQAAAQEAKTVAAAQPAPEPSRTPASANALNPGIAAVLNGFYVGASRDPAQARIPGFALGDSALGPPRGFSLGESEVALSAN